MNTTDQPRAVACIRFVRLVCEEWRCRWCGPEAEALRAPDPFNAGDTLIACPKCREQTLHKCCDDPTCTMEATCGTPTPEGYRWTCGKHQPNTRRSPLQQSPPIKSIAAAGKSSSPSQQSIWGQYNHIVLIPNLPIQTQNY
jgi:hypothetical protein